MVTVLDHAAGVVPLMITGAGRPFARNTPIDQEPRQAPPKPRPPPVPATAQVAHQHKLRRLPTAIGPISTRQTFMVGALGNADLAVLQPLMPAEAATPALGIPPTGPWLSRIRVPMVTVVSQGAARWATLDPTEAELHTIGQRNRLP